MAWRAKWGSEVETLLEVYKATGTMPPALKNRPELSKRWTFTDGVFDQLHGSRNYTARGPANIPFNQFYLWARANNFSRSEIAEVWDDLRQFDNAWLGAHNKQREQASANQKGTQ